MLAAFISCSLLASTLLASMSKLQTVTSVLVGLILNLKLRSVYGSWFLFSFLSFFVPLWVLDVSLEMEVGIGYESKSPDPYLPIAILTHEAQAGKYDIER